MKSEHHSRNGFLTVRGYAENAERISLEGLAPRGELGYIDSRVSVSGLRRDEEFHVFDDRVIDQQYRRFLESSDG